MQSDQHMFVPRRAAAMIRPLALIFVSLLLTTPAMAQPPAFTSDKPSPLKLIKSGKKWAFTEKFSGSVELSGRFSVAWVTPEYLEVTFFPDAASTALLPYERGRRRVEVLYLSNREQAAGLLLDAGSVQKILAKELKAATGVATIRIRAYETSVSCDTRGYSAELISASRTGEILIGARDDHRLRC